MAPNTMDLDNHVDMSSDANLSITLTIRGAPSWDRRGPNTMASVSPPDFRSVLPIRSIPPVVPVEETGAGWRCEDMLEEPPTPIKEEVPTFTFALPESQMPRTPPVKVEEGREAWPGNQMWSYYRPTYRAFPPTRLGPRAGMGSENGYSPPTVADFHEGFNATYGRPIPLQPSTNTQPNWPLGPEEPSQPFGAFEDYQMQLMLLEQQKKKKRDIMAGKDVERETCPSANSQPYHAIPTYNPVIQNYQRQLMAVQQRNRERWLQATGKQGTDEKTGPSLTNQPHQAPKVENCTRLTPGMEQMAQRPMLQQGEESQSAPPAGMFHTFQARVDPRRNAVVSDYEMQLMLLEQQNKRRLMQAREEQDRAGNA